MRNLDNAIKKVTTYKGKLSKSLVCSTAKQSLNQYARGWIKPKDDELVEAIAIHGIREFLERPLIGRKLDAELTAQGIDWLRGFIFTKSGQVRQNKDVRGFHYEEIVKKFSHFTFAGFSNDGYSNYVPIWRVHAKNGKSFKYTYTGGRFNHGGGFTFWGS